jgi:hypothetical protein
LTENRKGIKKEIWKFLDDNLSPEIKVKVKSRHAEQMVDLFCDWHLNQRRNTAEKSGGKYDSIEKDLKQL